MSIKAVPDPYILLHQWYEDARNAEPDDPEAACLATVDPQGLPDARIVLIRKMDINGFCFYTNYESAKGKELLSTPKAALNFYWKTLGRQVRVRGNVEQVPATESDAYYDSRPLGNRIGAWASQQSRPLDSRATLQKRMEEFSRKFGEHPERPDHWGGFLLVPSSIEFWQDGEFRLHHRILYKHTKAGWVHEMLYP